VIGVAAGGIIMVQSSFLERYPHLVEPDVEGCVKILGGLWLLRLLVLCVGVCSQRNVSVCGSSV
jgi:hypothetical protein